MQRARLLVVDQGKEEVLERARAGQVQILHLPHPKGSTGAVLLAGDAVYELQQVQRACPSSFLLDDTLSKESNLTVTTRLDLAFWMLPIVRRSCTRFVPFEQAFSSPEARPFARLARLVDPRCYCRVEDKLGDGTMLCQFDEERMWRWLQAKVKAAQEALHRVEERHFRASGTDASSLDEGHFLEPAVQMVCDALEDELVPGLRERCGLAREVPRSGAAASRPSWQQQAEDEERTQALLYGRKRGRGEPAKKAESVKKQAVARPKGVKAITSFFTKK